MSMLAAVRNSLAILMADVSTWLFVNVHREAVWGFGGRKNIKEFQHSTTRSNFDIPSRT